MSKVSAVKANNGEKPGGARGKKTEDEGKEYLNIQNYKSIHF